MAAFIKHLSIAINSPINVSIWTQMKPFVIYFWLCGIYLCYVDDDRSKLYEVMRKNKEQQMVKTNTFSFVSNVINFSINKVITIWVLRWIYMGVPLSNN